MVNKSKLNLLALMSDIDIEAVKQEAKEIGSKYVLIDFASQQYSVTAGLQDSSWSFVIKNESMHLSIEISHGLRAISPEIRAYTHGEEIDRTDQDFIFIELLCYHIEYEIFKRVAKKYGKATESKASIAEVVGLINPKEFVREFLALNRQKQKVWIKVKNPTKDPNKIESQCAHILTWKKYTGYTLFHDHDGRIQIREN